MKKELQISLSQLDLARKQLEDRVNGYKHGIYKKIDRNAGITSESNPAFLKEVVGRSVSSLQIVRDTLAKSGFENNAANIYSAFIASQFGMHTLQYLQDSKYFSKENVDLTRTYPYPLDDLLGVFSKALDNNVNSSLEELAASYFSWMGEQAVIARNQNEKECSMLNNITVKIGDDFSVSGFSSPTMSRRVEGNDWDSFAGYDNAVSYFKDLALIIRNYKYCLSLGLLDKSNLIPKGILVHGPSGTGKNRLVQIFCQESGAFFTEFIVSDIGSKWAYEAANNLQRKFDEAALQLKKGGYDVSILCIDEIDSITGVRNEAGNPGTKEVVAVMTSNMQGFKAVDGVTVIGITNLVGEVDTAVRSRFSEEFLMDYPDRKTTEQIFNIYARKFASDISIDKVVSKLEFGNGNGNYTYEEKPRYWTGRVVKQVTERAMRQRIIGHLKDGQDYKPRWSDLVAQVEAYKNGRQH